VFLGEFEHLVMLGILRCGESAFGYDVRREIEQATGRAISRGAFYTTLERLGEKGLVRWQRGVPPGSRGGHAQRRFRVTAAGMRALKAARRALVTLWSGVEGELGEPA
jgi:DNA-binding PadR family transcriptional regulator